MFTLPVCDCHWLHGVCDSIRDCLFLLCRSDGELGECIWFDLLVSAVITPDGVRNLESHELVKEGNFVEEEVDELVGVADVFTGGHVGRDLHAFVEGFESLLTLASPELGKACFDCVLGILIVLVEARLEVRNAEDCLEGCVDPTGSILVAKTEHSLLLEG